MSSVTDDLCAKRLKRALEQGAVYLNYQPKIDVASGAVTGVEALARWHDEELGEVPPPLFIGVAERCGLIDELTDTVMRLALRQWVAWRDQGLRVRIAVNVSALTLRDVYLPDHIQRMCMREGMPCEYLTIEVTESAAQNVVRLLDSLSRLRLKGISVSLDDFGTGYSSLIQLRQLPYSEIKIDQCFVRDAARSGDSRLIVKAVIDLAHGLGLAATAEGVEDAKALALLGELGCDQAQGYFIARPMRGVGLVEWLRHTGRSFPNGGPGVTMRPEMLHRQSEKDFQPIVMTAEPGMLDDLSCEPPSGCRNLRRAHAVVSAPASALETGTA
jgi:EAL domain-containing protein (putative c-di-GMP-specific phosphodiesterase class I)